ncbi:MAG TPA: hypothetical protein VJ499_01065 [Flavisolibacter sp.]|nr:hypothetical protein [Flavisolibacter sp.]
MSEMKILAAILLSLVILLQSFSKWIIMADYEINKNYISKNLCINKKRPKLHCNGKCQLMKKLAEEEKQNSTNGNDQGKVKSQDIVFFHSAQVFQPYNCVLLRSHPSSYIYNGDYDTPISSIFHPPSVA